MNDNDQNKMNCICLINCRHIPYRSADGRVKDSFVR